ncbi:MAG TPA: MBL fold metallo-hydrolase [Phnomibacter sp.]|nr:MBL fold metallo-hydrolase [Phnomibacter sp.]
MLQIQTFTVNPFQQNTYVLYTAQGECAVIDAGMYNPQEHDALAAFLKTQQLRPTLLLLTHAHLDHVFGLPWATQNFNLKPWLHPNEEPVLIRGPQAAMMFGVPFTPYTGPVNWMQAGQTFTLGNQQIETILAPGHSPGSICFYIPSQKILIGGDVLFNGSIGRTDLPGGHHDTLQKSIKDKLYTLPPDTVVYPGHGPTTTIGHEMKTNPFIQA